MIKLILFAVFLTITNMCFTAMRDPFLFAANQETKSQKKMIMLKGIVFVREGQSAALLACGEECEVIELGGVFQGHKLVSIDKETVTVMHGKRKQLLLIE